MVRKVISLTPDQLGYKDRGKMKWQGLMLSDHTDALKKNHIFSDAPEVIGKQKMTQFEIAEKIQVAFINKRPIKLQKDNLINGQYEPLVECMVYGYFDDKIYFSLNNGDKVYLELEKIRYVEYMDPAEWFQKK